MIDKTVVEKFAKEALKKLEGRFVIIGGAALSLVDAFQRVTMDIDCIALDDDGSQTVALMEIAETMGLPVESINQAGVYFLQKIPHYEEELISVFKNKRCEILRPNLKLYLDLKTNRLTDSDLSDCLNYIKSELPLTSDDQKRIIIKMLSSKSSKISDTKFNEKIDEIIKQIEKR